MSSVVIVLIGIIGFFVNPIAGVIIIAYVLFRNPCK